MLALLRRFVRWLKLDGVRAPDGRELIPTICTREIGHDGPCNGIPRNEEVVAAQSRRRIGSAVCPECGTIVGTESSDGGKTFWFASHMLTENTECFGSAHGVKVPSAATPVQRETPQLPTQKIWDKRNGGPIPYEELEGMFLDQFLLRYFYELMPQSGPYAINLNLGNSPWKSAVNSALWLKEMPVLFEQMTGYTLNEIQLNNAIAEWARRLSKTPASVS